MKLLITESKIKTLIQDKFGLDFTGDVLELNSVGDIINYFDGGCFSSSYLGDLLSKYGPMYLINVYGPFIILYQNNGNFGKLIMDEECQYYTEGEFMNLIGLDVLGLSMDQFISIYL
jgi:hypothetical protein